MIDFEKRRAQLLDRKAELTDRLTEIEAELEAHQSKDWEDMATEREGDEVLESMGASGKVEIALVNAALLRIDAGDYGYCGRCGEEISEKRLDVLPYTPVCHDCAAKQDHGH